MQQDHFNELVDVVGVDANKRQGKVVKNRKMNTSMRRTLIVAAKVMLLFVGASIYFAVSFSLEYKEFNRQYVSMAEQAYAARRNTLLGDSGVSIREFQYAAFRPTLFRPLGFAVAAGTAVCVSCAASRALSRLCRNMHLPVRHRSD